MTIRFFIIILSLFSTIEAIGQCAMCKAVVEANLESGGTKGAGLNDGILFLMSMPYLAFFLFCLLFYFQNKKQKALN
tara:strand:+ start:770 stop:1000 length:231 start_codon:yes stop_codon:yes gene_type:complete